MILLIPQDAHFEIRGKGKPLTSDQVKGLEISVGEGHMVIGFESEEDALNLAHVIANSFDCYISRKL